MKIGIDYDGTIANTNLVKSIWIKDNLGLDIPPWTTDKSSCVPALAKHMALDEAIKIYDGFKKFIYSGDYAKNAPEIPGAIEAIESLSQNHELYLVTARAKVRVKYAIRWLNDHGLKDCFKGFYSSKSKGKGADWVLSKQEICNEYGLKILIDDDERHLKHMSSKGLERILIKNGALELPVLEGVNVVRSWGEVLNLI